MTAAVLSTLGLLLAGYEWVALNTDLGWPTITKLVQATPFWVRVLALTALPTYLWVDHIWWDGGIA